MKTLCTLLLLALTQIAFCCTCAPKMPFKKEEDLKEYTFIARVKIIKLAPISSQPYSWKLRTNGDIGIEVKELFKGQSTNLVFDDAFNSDCALHLAVGEEWLFFGNPWNGHLSVSLCSYSVRYRDSLGKREWEYNTGLKELDALRRIYIKPLSSNLFNVQHYENGKIEVEQKLKGGKLNGVRKIYYPNGKLFIVEQFENDVRVGVRNTYLPSGQLRSRTEYENGLKKKEEHYLDTTDYNGYFLVMAKRPHDLLFGDQNPKHDSLYYINLRDSLMHLSDWGKRVSFYYVYGDDGRSYTMKSYGYMGNVEREGYVDWPQQLYEYSTYHKDGKLETHSRYDYKNNRLVEHTYFENGKENHIDRKCQCEIYFDPKQPPRATPDKGYIQ